MPEHLYTAPYLGEIDEKTYLLLGGMIEGGLIKGLETRINFLRRREDIVSLTDLARIIEFDLDDFVEQPTMTLQKYGKPYLNT